MQGNECIWSQSVSSYQVALGFCKAWICGWLYLGFPAHQRMADEPMGQVGTYNTFPATCRLAHSHSPSASPGRESPRGALVLLWMTQKQVRRPQVHTTNWGGLMSPGRKMQPPLNPFYTLFVQHALLNGSFISVSRPFSLAWSQIIQSLSHCPVSDMCVRLQSVGAFDCVLSLHWPHKVVSLKRLCAIQ